MTGSAATPAGWRATDVGARCLAAALLLCASGARAQSCTVSSPSVNFGMVNMVSGTTYTPSGTQITVNCSYPNVVLSQAANFSVCLNVGGTSGTAPRAMTYSGNSLNYNLYSNSTLTNIWGSSNSGNPSNVAVSVTTNTCNQLTCSSISGNATTTIYGQLPSTGNTTAPAGTYTQNLTGSAPFNASVGLFYLLLPASSCTSGTTYPDSSGNFVVASSATVINYCSVSATSINFGNNVGSLSSPISATGNIKATCTAGDSYTIALNGGTTSGATVAGRMMAGSGSAVVNYQLYTSSSYGTAWGDGTFGTGTQGGIGTGGSQPYTVYGLVPTQATPAAGSYSDVITVTVTY